MVASDHPFSVLFIARWKCLFRKKLPGTSKFPCSFLGIMLNGVSLGFVHFLCGDHHGYRHDGSFSDTDKSSDFVAKHETRYASQTKVGTRTKARFDSNSPVNFVKNAQVN